MQGLEKVYGIAARVEAAPASHQRKVVLKGYSVKFVQVWFEVQLPLLIDLLLIKGGKGRVRSQFYFHFVGDLEHAMLLSHLLLKPLDGAETQGKDLVVAGLHVVLSILFKGY